MTERGVPRPDGVTALPLPSSTAVARLQRVQEYPAVSVLCATSPGPRLTGADAARLAALVAEAVDRLDSEFARQETAALRDRLAELTEDALRRPTRLGLALFASASHGSSWSLPVRVADRSVVDPTFATRDLLRAVHRTPRHLVLVLTDRQARLLDGVGDTLVPAVGSAFPLTAEPDEPRAGGKARRPRRSGGQGGDDAVEAFLRTIDRALGAYRALHPAPLVVVGAQRTLARFLALSRNLGRLAGTVQGSHARTPAPVLVDLVRPVLEGYLRSRQEEALALLEARHGADRVLSGMPAAWFASRAERPEMLAVEEGLFYPARLSPDGDLLMPAEDVEHPDVIDDAVDELIETVLRRGGWVALTEDGALSAYERVALAVRGD